MENETVTTERTHSYNEGREEKKQYRRLFRRFVLLTVVCSILPLLVVGWGIFFHYSRLSETRVTRDIGNEVEHHRKVIELFLDECSSSLQLVAQTLGKEYLTDRMNLQRVFDLLNSEGTSITDLGVIDEHGKHLMYIGPYDLMDKNYSGAFWFRKVLEEGLYISDMFTGFRNVPHFVIAVTASVGYDIWILRATIDTEAFRSLVETVTIGKTGEVYLVNEEGYYQTSPRFDGAIMEKADILVEPIHEGIRTTISVNPSPDKRRSQVKQIVSRSWLEKPPWMLVVKQDYSEAMNEVNHANRATAFFLLISALIILVVTIMITRYMITLIKKRDEEADRLNSQLMQAGKLAAIGELAAGVAHEINNPLAIILTEKQLLLDQQTTAAKHDEEFRNQFMDSMSQIEVQIQRCKRITQNLLRFSRRTRSVVEPIDINAFVLEVIELMEREALTSGVEFVSDLQEDRLVIRSDPSQLQQVLLNLITNAIDAHSDRTSGTITVQTREDALGQGVVISIEDTGVGIPSENMNRIFDPFFTTKPVGKGTGLGLSICFSTMKRLGGTIIAESKLGMGTVFTLFLPANPPARLLDDLQMQSIVPNDESEILQRRVHYEGVKDTAGG